MIRNIVVPIDGSEHANRAVEFAADLASKYGARLHIFHVLLSGHVPEDIRALSDKEGVEQPPIAIGGGYVEAALPSDVLKDIGAKLLERAEKTAREHGATDVDTASAGGSAPERILAHAKEVDADTIVMGCRGLSDLRGMLVGSVSHKVQHLFDGRVVTVK